MEWLKKIHNFLIDKEKVKLELYWITKIWYFLLLALSTIYVSCNFDTLVTQCFICQFNGNCLIFILWLILLFLPLFNSIEGYGFKFKRQEEESLKIRDWGNEIMKGNTIPEINTLEEKLETIIKENKNE